MDINTVIISGKLAVKPERHDHLDTAGGATLYRVLVTTKATEPHRRTDVIPAHLWDPDEATSRALHQANAGDRIVVTGSLQRRFWDGPDGRKSRIELVASEITLNAWDPEEATR
jgi:single-stranded DNA-binding protein